jgi:hypothetical protein
MLAHFNSTSLRASRAVLTSAGYDRGYGVIVGWDWGSRFGRPRLALESKATTYSCLSIVTHSHSNRA